MNCEKIEEFLSLYLEDEIGLEEKKMVDNHLQRCQACALIASTLKETREALSGFPELEVSRSLLKRLYAISEREKKFSFSLDFLLKPSLQPVFSVATVIMIVFSLYLFHPNKKYIDRAIDQKIHLGYSQVEKLYAEAGSWTDRLGDYKDNILLSIKNLRIFGGSEE